jgi:hypothetical protein
MIMTIWIESKYHRMERRKGIWKKVCLALAKEIHPQHTVRRSTTYRWKRGNTSGQVLIALRSSDIRICRDNAEVLTMYVLYALYVCAFSEVRRVAVIN